MNTLVLGAGGLLGTALVRTAPPHVRLHAFRRAELDLTNHSAVAAALARLRPAVVLNAAALASVDRAELSPDEAWAVNVAAVAALGASAADAGVRVLHVGTDYVFDGRAGAPYDESARPNPLNVYGRTKLAGERRLFASGARALVVRVQGLFGRAGEGFPARMLERARRGLATRVVTDQVRRPTPVEPLAAALWRLALADGTGVLHLAGRDDATWYDVARVVFESAGRPELLTPCTTEELAAPAPRPLDTRLDSSRAERMLDAALPPWRPALMRALGAAARGA